MICSDFTPLRTDFCFQPLFKPWTFQDAKVSESPIESIYSKAHSNLMGTHDVHLRGPFMCRCGDGPSSACGVSGFFLLTLGDLFFSKYLVILSDNFIPINSVCCQYTEHSSLVLVNSVCCKCTEHSSMVIMDSVFCEFTELSSLVTVNSVCCQYTEHSSVILVNSVCCECTEHSSLVIVNSECCEFTELSSQVIIKKCVVSLPSLAQ